MAQALRTSLQAGGLTQGGLRPGLGGDNIFASSALDLNFGMTKSLGGLVTFTRASSGTYVGSNGVLQTATTNLLLRSEEFSDAYWNKAATSVVANDTASPTGSITADRLVEDSANSQHTIGSQTISWLGNTQYTFTLYAKAAGRDTFDLLLGTAANWVSSNRVAIFNLTSGTVEVQDGSPVVASIQNVGSGWFRCRITATTVASPSASGVFLRLYDKSALSGGISSYQGNGTSGIYLWGAQLEQSSTVGEYIPTTSTINSAPRFDHNPTTGESLGLLVEEQRTNLLLRSEELDNASWLLGGGTVTANTQPAPTGAATADTFTTTSGTPILYQDVTCTASTVYTFSFYVRLGTMPASDFRFAVRDNTGAAFIATDIAPSVTPVTTEWRRVSYTFTTPVGCVQVRPYLYRFTFVTGGTVHLWGAQLEQGAFPTSHIPTTTATATRSADVASITGSNFSSWYRQDEGTVFTDASVSYVVPATSFPLMASLNDGTQNNRIENGYLTAGLGGYEVVAGGVAQVGVYPGANTQARRLATAYRVNDFAACLNNGTLNTDLSGTVPTVDRLRLGNRGGGSSNDLFGTIRRLTYWPVRLGNTVLQQITQ